MAFWQSPQSVSHMIQSDTECFKRKCSTDIHQWAGLQRTGLSCLSPTNVYQTYKQLALTCQQCRLGR